MLSDRELSAAIGSAAYGPDGDKIGTVEHFFVDDRTGEPTWVAVSTGLFGTRHSIVPAADAAFDDGGLRVPVTKEAVRHAPSVGSTDHLDPGDEALLREHYGLTGAAGPTGGGALTGAGGRPHDDTVAIPRRHPGAVDAGTGADRAGGEATGDGAMTRSEERLRVATEQVPATRVRLVKYVVTEEVQITVPVRREEVRVEEVPFDAPDAGPGESLTDDTGTGGSGRHATPDGTTEPGPGSLPREIVLHREEPVVDVRVVPAERVRLRTEVVEGQERVSGQVQRERITVDEHPAPRP